MIVPMKKVFVVCRPAEREETLERIRRAGVLHPEPLGPAGDSLGQLAHLRAQLERAIAVLEPRTPVGAAPELALDAAAEEAVGLDRARAELAARAEQLERQLAELSGWGELRLSEVQALQASGLHLAFATLPEGELARVRADLAQVLERRPKGQLLVGLASRTPLALPPSADLLELPPTDRPTLRAELQTVTARLLDAEGRLGQLRHLLPRFAERAAALGDQLALLEVSAGGLRADDFFGVQGWIPAAALDALEAETGERGAVYARDPLETELPPTLLRPPKWAASVSGLMQVLGLSPGYREADVSVAFMVAIPLFAAILISDAGYGSLIALAPLLFYRRAVAALGRPLTHFLVVIGGAAVVWGAMTGSFFGVDLAQKLTGGPPLISVKQEDGPMRLLMHLSFTIGVVHLSLAQAWKAVLLAPSQAALARAGWAIFLWGMYGVVLMFVLRTPFDASTPWPYCLGLGAALAVLFGNPDQNPVKQVALGLANFPLSALSTFSDIMSYVRLMAVGLAGSVLAASFNELAPAAGPWLSVPILFFGHSLNLGLCLIALFAHGVRLNVLEFSNNFGLEWGGYPYLPFQAQPRASTQQES